MGYMFPDRLEALPSPLLLLQVRIKRQRKSVFDLFQKAKLDLILLQ